MKNRLLPMPPRAAELLRRLRVERWTLVAVAVAFVVALIIILATTQLHSLAVRGGESWTAGMVAEKDFVVERDFQYVDENATQMRRDAQARTVPPVYLLNILAGATALDVLDRFARSLQRLARQELPSDQIFAGLEEEFPGRVSRGELRVLLATRNPAQTLQHARDFFDAALSRGIADMIAHADEAAAAGAIELRRMQDGRMQSEEIPLADVVTRDTLWARTNARLPAGMASDLERRAIHLLIEAFVSENAFYDAQTTLQRRDEARAKVPPVTEKLTRGQILVHRGETITEAAALKIRALGDYERTLDINGVVGDGLFLLLIFIVALFLLAQDGPHVQLRRGHVLLLLALGAAYLVLSAIVVRLVSMPDWMPASVAIPTSMAAMLVAILVSRSVGVFFTLAVSLCLLLLTGMGVQSFLFAFFSGIAATAVVIGAEKRIDLIRAGLLLSLADALIFLVLGLLGNYEPRMVISLIGGGIANGFLCGILTLGFLPIFELMLNAPTRFKLMELSDLNSAIFKRMLSQAPGTYTHSISVANLAETACEAIGANALLARVSAYYHDIGKVDQADYFVENQKAYNRHDKMRPSLSVAVIKSHVRIGMEKARELKLPQAIIDIIAQHHGRGLITYFYHRAVKEGRNPRLSKDDYSYPGVRPKSKEAAVLMLADAVEAASRALKNPTEIRLERFVQEMIMEKFNSGELGDSSLTLRDLELIRKSFVHILEGYFHTRIEYPKLARGTRSRP